MLVVEPLKCDGNYIKRSIEVLVVEKELFMSDGNGAERFSLFAYSDVVFMDSKR